jgi:hypothetical protein
MTTILLNTFGIEPRDHSYFLRGMAEAFNLRGSTERCYHFAGSADEADAAAVQNDWLVVGEDLDSAFDAVSTR